MPPTGPAQNLQFANESLASSGVVLALLSQPNSRTAQPFTNNAGVYTCTGIVAATGKAVQLANVSGTNLPADAWMIATSATTFRLATSLANALAGTAIVQTGTLPASATVFDREIARATSSLATLLTYELQQIERQYAGQLDSTVSTVDRSTLATSPILFPNTTGSSVTATHVLWLRGGFNSPGDDACDYYGLAKFASPVTANNGESFSVIAEQTLRAEL